MVRFSGERARQLSRELETRALRHDWWMNQALLYYLELGLRAEDADHHPASAQ